MEQLDERLKAQYASLSPARSSGWRILFSIHFDDLISYNGAELAQLSAECVESHGEPPV